MSQPQPPEPPQTPPAPPEHPAPAPPEHPERLARQAGRRVWHRLIVALCLAAFVAVALGAARHWLLELRMADEAKPVVVEIPSGLGVGQIGQLLTERELIHHPLLFRLAARITQYEGPLKSGEYQLSASMSQRGILEALRAGRVYLHGVVIPEGFTAAEIVDRLAGEGLVDAADATRLLDDPEFIASLGLEVDHLEGYLFPDTYRMARGLSARHVLGHMVRRFQKAWRGLASLAQGSDLDQRQAVILASIIEKETRLAAERPLVSAVYRNRLKLGMLLQADPTVIYGLDDLEGPLLRKHLTVDHEYNTYLKPGLPPGPICSPGLASLKAALQPAPVKYLYFVAKGDGSHAFSQNYRDQVNNINRYRR